MSTHGRDFKPGFLIYDSCNEGAYTYSSLEELTRAERGMDELPEDKKLFPTDVIFVLDVRPIKGDIDADGLVLCRHGVRWMNLMHTYRLA